MTQEDLGMEGSAGLNAWEWRTGTWQRLGGLRREAEEREAGEGQIQEA